MPKKKEWVENTKPRIIVAISSGILNGYEEGFLMDILKRLEEYGVNVRLSDKQEFRLFQYLSKAEGNDL